MRTPGDLTRTWIYIPAMDCPDEEKEIRAALSRLPVVESLTFRLFSRQVEVRHRGEVEPILDALRRIGMEGRLPDDVLRRAELPSSDRTPRNTFLLSGAAERCRLPCHQSGVPRDGGGRVRHPVDGGAGRHGTTLPVIFNGLRLLRARTS
jgi:copper chaperone CopZ